jgi:hypothetical protein
LNADKLSLDLQFATDKSLTARKGPTPTFTRASGATEVGSDGLIRYAPENLILRSEEFDNAAVWTRLPLDNQPTITANAAISPFGQLTADKINFPAPISGIPPRVEQSRNTIEGSIFTFSFWIRADSPTTVRTGHTTSSETVNVTTSWERISYTYVSTSGGFPRIAGPSSGAAEIYLWGAQLERHSSARTYIPTTTAAVFNARFDHDPITLACNGLLIEESRTNLVFPSATLTTQTRTVTAAAHTLSFYGTGTVVLSGTHVATVTGTGAFPTRTTLTFTPTAGSLILTVTGTVQFAQLEAGGFPTSYIPTTTASVVRSADVCSITGSAFTGMYNQSEGTMLVNASTPANGDRTVLATDDDTANEMIRLRTEGTNPFFKVTDGGSEVVAIDAGTVTVNTTFKLAGAYKLDDFAASINGGAAVTDTAGTISTVDRIRIGAGQGGNTMCGHIASVRYFKKRLPDAKLVTITT